MSGSPAFGEARTGQWARVVSAWLTPPPVCRVPLPTFLFCIVGVLKFYHYWCGSFFINFTVNSVDSFNLEIHVLYSWEVYLYYFFDHFFSFIFFILFRLNSLFKCWTSWTYHLIFLSIHSHFPSFCHFGLFSKTFLKFTF